MAKHTTGVTFRASVSLMEDYRLGTELTAQTALTQVVNAKGEGELFYTGVDGKGNVVIYNVYPDSGSDTGWSVATLAPGFEPGQMAGGVDGGMFTLFCLGPDSSNPDINYAQRDANGNWGAWQHVDPSSIYGGLVPPVYVRNFAAGAIGGKLEVAAVLNDANGRLSMWRVDWKGVLRGWQQLGPVDSPFLDFCSTLAWGEGVLGAQVNAAQPVAMDLLLFTMNGAAPATVAAQQYFRNADSSLVTPPGAGMRYSGVFLYNDALSGGSKGISYLDCSVANPRAVVIDTSLSVEQMVAVDAGANPISFMALDQHMKLNVISHEDAGGGWNPAIELGETLSSITAGLDATGAPLVFAVDAKGSNLFSMLKQPFDQGGEWTKQAIEAQVQTVEKKQVYGTAFTLMDGAGNLLRNQTVQVGSPETTVIGWQNQSFVIGPNTAAQATTDANGRLVLYAPTGTINANKVTFAVPGITADGDAIVVDPDGPIQARLKNLSLQDTQALLPAQFQQDAASVQQAINTAMSYSTLAPRAHQGARLVTAAARIDRYEQPIDPESGAVRHWHFSVRGGRAMFRELTEAQAKAMRAEIIAGASGKPADLGGFFDFLGDIVDAVVNAVETAFDYVVSVVSGVVNAVINCVINGVKYVFDGVIRTIERAFQIAESIFAAVQVFFQRLFDFLAWLLSGARQDIWNTKKAFESALNQGCPTIVSLAQQGEAKAGAFFAGLKTTIASTFDAIIADYGGMNFATPSGSVAARRAQTALGSSLDIADVVHEAEVKAMWLLEKIMSPMGSPGFSATVPASVTQAIAAFNTAANARIGADIQAQITTTTSYLQSVATNPGNFASSTVVALLQTAKNLILLVLDIIDALVKAFLDAVIALFNGIQQWVLDQPISGFFLQALYDMLNPEGTETLTVSRLIAVTLAFPVTILYRIITGQSPYSARAIAAPGLTGDHKSSMQIIGGLMLMVYAYFDIKMEFDDLGDPLSNALTCLLPTLIDGYLCPGNDLFSLKPVTTHADTLENLGWSLHMVASGVATLEAFLHGFTVNPRSAPYVLFVLCGSGATELALAIAKRSISPDQGHTETFVDVVSPLSSIVKPLRLVRNPYAEGAMAVVDGLSDFGQGVGQIILGLSSTSATQPHSIDSSTQAFTERELA